MDNILLYHKTENYDEIVRNIILFSIKYDINYDDLFAHMINQLFIFILFLRL
jgi:hypothetical protein